MKIKAKEALCNVTLILPDLGKITIPEDGILEVSDTLAEALVNSKIGYSYLNASDKPKVELEDGEETIEETEEEIDYTDFTTDQLVDLATEAGLPEKEWRKFADNAKDPHGLMVKYITKKLKK